MTIIRTLLAAALIAAGLAALAAEPIDINTADKETLMAVRGVGERRAEAIIVYREKYGPFRTVDQLMEVEGIGQATLDANREMLTVGNPPR